MIYEKVKNVIKILIPQRILINQEQRLRKLVFIFYKGSNHKCPICEKKIRTFIQLKTGDKLCPGCGSLDRHRRLWTILQSYVTSGIRLLDFSPPRCLYRKLKNTPGIEYTPTDFSGEFLASTRLDITQLDLENNSYDLITCYHVLEHIEKDVQAMQELYRVLKPGGFCFIQTPFKEGDLYENLSIKNPEQRKEHFGQVDHIRIYSIDGLSQRLSSAGFTMKQLNFSEEENNYYGFHQHETVFIATK